MEHPKTRYVKVSVPEALHEELRVEAARREVSLQAVALERLQRHVPKEQPKAPKSVPAEQPEAPKHVPKTPVVVPAEQVSKSPPKEEPKVSGVPIESAVVGQFSSTLPPKPQPKADLGAWASRDFSKVKQAGRREKK